MDYELLKREVQKRLSAGRYRHSLAVADTAVKMARFYGKDVSAARVAGLLHDLARDLPGQELVNIARTHNLIEHPLELELTFLLHGPVGAFLALTELDVQDQQVLSAIKNHTTGAPNMNDLEKIIFLADMIEPGRVYPGVEALRENAFLDLDRALELAYEHLLLYLIREKRPVHPKTVEARNYILMKSGRRAKND
ncbi:bis(5'-nucleosyl)-tetraphosphatase (symmetrical) YqeK [Calderihabitans maritimus]|uniref:bis(5'-nucleosyl)-tetraphosphatase (symmetrical) n=1 Tax=Calderihabitans maritimus TaxID=1246530 RepID=A0A1Z5HS93_9FIRM|nr:bis(5'-nucleosyl)-tetraphosphatase (symmetrical) YqeK [Calderihabitans maritimus]GAW92396.1 hydrolase [Calderihabitans maritimus]